MPDVPTIGDALLEISGPDKPSRSVHIDQSPFLIGRGSGNQVQLSDGRISRTAAAILAEDGCSIEDRGQRGGMFVNGKVTIRCAIDYLKATHCGGVWSYGQAGRRHPEKGSGRRTRDHKGIL